MAVEIFDPTYEEGPSDFASSPRLASLAGTTVGIISNGKQGTGRFFDALAQHLQSTYDVHRVERLVKANYSAPAGDDIIDATKHWQAVISGIGD